MARNERGGSLSAGELFAGRYRITGVVRTWNGRAVYGAIDEQTCERRELRLGPAHPCPGWRTELTRKQTKLDGAFHPNLIRVHQIGDEPVPYLVTSVTRGTSWAQAVRGRDRAGAIDEGLIASTLHQLLDALQAMHARDQVHGEIAPGNVFVSRGRVHLLDGGLFGLNGFAFVEPWSRVLGVLEADATRYADRDPVRSGRARAELDRMLAPWDLDIDDVHALTPYLAPEVVAGTSRDARSDLFGVGVMLFELLSGQLPFATPRSAEEIAASCAHTPPFVTDLEPQAPPFLSALCQSLLERRPEDRVESATSALERLESFYAERDGIDLPRSRWDDAVTAEPTLVAALAD